MEQVSREHEIEIFQSCCRIKECKNVCMVFLEFCAIPFGVE